MVNFFGKVIKEEVFHDVECDIKSKNSYQALQVALRDNQKNMDPKSNGINFTSFMKKNNRQISSTKSTFTTQKKLGQIVQRIEQKKGINCAQ